MGDNMKRLLLASAICLAVSPALADSIFLTATVDGGAAGSASSPDGTLNIVDQAFGVFNLNTLTINSQEFLAAPGVLNTNTLDIDQVMTGDHTLVLDIVASGLVGSGALENFLSTFSVTGLTAGWTAREQTFINGSQLADTGFFTNPSDSALSTDAALMTNPFQAEVVYSLASVGTGQFNGGIDISVAAVPEPATWGMMLLGFAGLGFAFRNRRRIANQLA
jgi:hypothetical protein